LFYITGGAPQAVPGTACVEANRTACIEDTCSSVWLNKLVPKSEGIFQSNQTTFVGVAEGLFRHLPVDYQWPYPVGHVFLD
jgi:hypothetical protein